ALAAIARALEPDLVGSGRQRLQLGKTDIQRSPYAALDAHPPRARLDRRRRIVRAQEEQRIGHDRATYLGQRRAEIQSIAQRNQLGTFPGIRRRSLERVSQMPSPVRRLRQIGANTSL